MEEETKIPEPPQPNIPLRVLNLGTSFNRQKGEVWETPIILKEDFLVCLLFANSKCSMCANFLPRLVEFYGEINLERKALEIVYVPVFEDREKYLTFQRQMPWLYIPPLDDRVDGLIDYYKIKSIPKLVVLRRDGSPLTLDGKKHVYARGEAAFDDWKAALEAEADKPATAKALEAEDKPAQ